MAREEARQDSRSLVGQNAASVGMTERSFARRNMEKGIFFGIFGRLVRRNFFLCGSNWLCYSHSCRRRDENVEIGNDVSERGTR